MTDSGITPQFITICDFVHDLSKPGRRVSTAKIGDVFMTRVEIEPGVITGGYYHKETEVVFYVAKGRVHASFEQVCTKKRKEFILDPGRHIVQIPPCHKISTQNVGKGNAILVFFSNRELRSKSDSFREMDEGTCLGERCENQLDMFNFQQDKSNQGRILATAKVGSIYISRLVLSPKKVIGDYYHKQTDLMFYVAYGQVDVICEQIDTKERYVGALTSATRAIQMPSGVCARMTNPLDDPSALIMFSSRRLNTGDEFDYPLD
ncbi:MAG: hypothetical protein HOE53_02795 [Candidatus Magasanikbacteria bacterium]|jgi:mannose-6-phosphate isomerase-like protein (cupin superfamily)|nr:hypothetical protein [Candidatus Magasanikbacteria bacterium]